MANEVRSGVPEQPGPACMGPWVRIAEAIYTAVTTGKPADRNAAMKALREAGRSETEAATLYTTAASVAQKAGSAQAFVAILRGEAEVPARLSAQEIAMLGGIGRASRVYGRTWEGSSGRTWEGNSGRTWEGSAVVNPPGGGINPRTVAQGITPGTTRKS